MGLDHARRKSAEPVLTGPNRLRLWVLPASICLVMLLAELGGEPARAVLRYAREPVANGEAWRLLSGHFVHLGWQHLLMNAAALLLIWALVGDRQGGQRWLLAVLLIIAGIDAGFWFIDRQLAWYVGLSGVLHGILLVGLVVGWRQRRSESLVLLVLLAAKLLFEQVYGPLPGSETSAGGAVVVNAHLYGAIAGLLVAGLFAVRVRRQPPI